MIEATTPAVACLVASIRGLRIHFSMSAQLNPLKTECANDVPRPAGLSWRIHPARGLPSALSAQSAVKGLRQNRLVPPALKLTRYLAETAFQLKNSALVLRLIETGLVRLASIWRVTGRNSRNWPDDMPTAIPNWPICVSSA